MWSHTIQSSKPNKAPATKDPSAKVVTPRVKRLSVDEKKDADSSQNPEIDGPSKDARVRPSKRPITVAKAPALGRTTSKREEEPATPTDSPRPRIEKRGQKATPAPAKKEGVSVRAPRPETPIRPSSAASKAKTPAISARAKPASQAAGTPTGATSASVRPVVKSSKAGVTSKRPPTTGKPLPKARDSAQSELESQNNECQEKEQIEAAAHKDSASTDHDDDQIPTDSVSKNVSDVGTLFEEQAHDEANSTIDTPQETQIEGKPHEAHEDLNREITLRNVTIRDLRKELQSLRTAHESDTGVSELGLAAQVSSLRAELDSVCSTLVDLDDTHRLALEKHDSLLRSRDKIIQNLSIEAQELREKVEANDKAKEQIAEAPQEKPQGTGQVQRDKHDEITARSRDEEIQSLSEVILDLRKQLEAADTARAKEIYDELLRSKDEKIESVSGVVKNLRGELKAAKPVSKQKSDEKLLRSKDEEIHTLSDTVRELKVKLDLVEQAREQEVNHSVTSLRDEFRDLQNKHKRKTDDLEAAASKRVETLQSDYDQLLRSRDQEIKDMAGMTQDLQGEIETARKGQQEELENANTRYDQQLKNTKIEYEERLGAKDAECAQDIERIKADHQDEDSRHQSSLQGLIRKHKAELESLQAEQQSTETSHQQELRELKRKHEQMLESLKTEAQDEVRGEMAKLSRELEDASTRHQEELDHVARKHHDEIAENEKDHEEALKELALKHTQELEVAGMDHERSVETVRKESEAALQEEAQRHRSELEEVNKKYQQELADVEMLRGQSSEDVSQEHEKQLKMIADKYQYELSEAAGRLDDTRSRHGKELHEVKTMLDESKAQSEAYRRELEETRGKFELFENDNRVQGQRLHKWAAEHDHRVEAIAAKYQETISQASERLDQLREAMARQNQEQQDIIADKGSEVEQVRRESVKITAEMTSLQATIEESKTLRSNDQSEFKRVHQQEVDDMSSRHEQECHRLRADGEAAAANIASLNSALKDSETSQSKALSDAAVKHEQLLRNAKTEHDEIVGHLRQEYEDTTQELNVLKKQARDSDQMKQEGTEEMASLREQILTLNVAREEAKAKLALVVDDLELSNQERVRCEDAKNILQTEVDGLKAQTAHHTAKIGREREEAAGEIGLLNDRKDIVDQENRHNTDIITNLRKDIDQIHNQLQDALANLKRERHEAAVEIALLRDKLELAELQRQSASEDMSLSRNEWNVEIALLRDKLELAELQSQQDKKTIVSLEDQLRVHSTKSPQTIPYRHHQLREELAMLGRHHATNLADVAALKASILAEREVRENEWRSRAERRDGIAKEMQGIGAELNGIVGAH